MPDEPRLLIFDCDGTLVDSQAIICTAMEHAFAALSLEAPERPEIRSTIGLSLPEAIARLAAGAPIVTQRALVEQYKAAFRECRHDPALREPLFDGVVQTLAHLGRNHATHLAIATGKSRRGLMAVLDQHDLSGVFQSLHTSDDGPSKPHPHMAQAAIAVAGVSPSRTAVIGDTGFDMAMAVAAGAVPIGVDWGYHSADMLARAGASEIASAFSELPAIVDRHIPVE